MQLYFRLNGDLAGIFRVDAENRQRRLQLVWIGRVNAQTDELMLGEGVTLSAEESAEIKGFAARRRKILAERREDTLRAVIEEMNRASIWLGSEASDADIEAIGDELLLALHDLRDSFVRRKSQKGSD